MKKTSSQTNNSREDKYVITVRQSSSIISSTIIGVGVLTLPRSAVQYAGQAGWICAVTGGLLSMLSVFFLTRLNQRFPGKGIVEYASIIMGPKRSARIGRWISLPLILVLIGYFILFTSAVSRVFGEVVITTVLTKTPLEVITGTMLLTSLLLAVKQAEVMARVNELLLPVIIFPVLIIALSSFQSARLENFLPIVFPDWISFVKGIVYTSFSYLGLAILFFTNEWTRPSTRLVRYNLLSIVSPLVIYTLIVISGISVFGIEELSLLAWPTLELVKTTEVPGLILERLESAFLGVWVAAVFTTVANAYFVTCEMFKKLLGLKKKHWIAFLLLPLLYYLAMIPQNIHILFHYVDYIGYLGGFVDFLLPVILLMLAVMRKRGLSGKEIHQQQEEEDMEQNRKEGQADAPV